MMKMALLLLPRVNELTNAIEYPDNYDKARHFSLTVGGEEWVMKSSFIDSMSKDKHYTVEVNQDNTVTIIFGDGVNGAIPKGRLWQTTVMVVAQSET